MLPRAWKGLNKYINKWALREIFNWYLIKNITDQVDWGEFYLQWESPNRHFAHWQLFWMIAIMLRFFAKIFIPSNHSNWCCCCCYADGLAATSSLTQEEKENSFFLLHSHTHTHTLTWTHTLPHTHSLFHLSTFTRTSSLLIFSFLPKNNFLFDNFFSVCRDFCPSEGRPLEVASAQDFLLHED